MTFFIIMLTLLCALVVYVLAKQIQGTLRQKKLLQRDSSRLLGEAHFTTWTGALRIGNETISYYSYSNQPELSRVEALLRKAFKERIPASNSRGKVLNVETTTSGRRIFKAMIRGVWILGAALLVWKNILLPSEQAQRVLISSTFGVVVSLYLLFDIVYHSILNKWELSNENIVIGRWLLQAVVPLKQIKTLTIEIAREKLRKHTRHPCFVLDIKHDEQNTQFHDTRLSNLLPLYDAIISRRPDLKVV